MKIKACPWCKIVDENEQAIAREVLTTCNPRHVICSCGAAGPHADTRKEAIEKWNRAAAEMKGAKLELIDELRSRFIYSGIDAFDQMKGEIENENL